MCKIIEKQAKCNNIKHNSFLIDLYFKKGMRLIMAKPTVAIVGRPNVVNLLFLIILLEREYQ